VRCRPKRPQSGAPLSSAALREGISSLCQPQPINPPRSEILSHTTPMTFSGRAINANRLCRTAGWFNLWSLTNPCGPYCGWALRAQILHLQSLTERPGFAVIFANCYGQCLPMRLGAPVDSFFWDLEAYGSGAKGYCRAAGDAGELASSMANRCLGRHVWSVVHSGSSSKSSLNSSFKRQPACGLSAASDWSPWENGILLFLTEAARSHIAKTSWRLTHFYQLH